MLDKELISEVFVLLFLVSLLSLFLSHSSAPLFFFAYEISNDLLHAPSSPLLVPSTSRLFFF